MAHPLHHTLEAPEQGNVAGKMDSLWVIYAIRQKDFDGLPVL